MNKVQLNGYVMKTYKITATRIDNNGVRVWSSNAETLGEAFRKSYSTREEAESAKEYLDDSKDDFGMEDAEYEVAEE